MKPAPDFERLDFSIAKFAPDCLLAEIFSGSHLHRRQMAWSSEAVLRIVPVCLHGPTIARCRTPLKSRREKDRLEALEYFLIERVDLCQTRIEITQVGSDKLRFDRPTIQLENIQGSPANLGLVEHDSRPAKLECR